MTSAVDNLLSQMVAAAEGAFKGSWNDIKSYTVPELEKVASTIVSIEGQRGPPVATLRTLPISSCACRLGRRRRSSSPTTGLLLLEVEDALNAILGAIADVVNKVVGFPLLALA